jgi:type IV pilus assembly protein PilB
LRHDPDVVMVGEMRDRPTAELAIKLANTGHLTFSTLHTNDAASAISRLYKMGIEPFLIAYAINLVVAQRLIRKLCGECKRPVEDPDLVLLKNLGFTEEERAQVASGELVLYEEGEDDGCSRCRGLGYKGRRAVAEALYFSRRIRHMVADAAEEKLDEMAVKAAAQEEGMLTLQDSARTVVKAGESSVREMMRVISTDD